MKRILLGTAVGLATLAVANVAQALPTYNMGSFAFDAFTSTTSDVTTTTSFALTSPALTTGAGFGDFTLVALPATLSVATPLDFTDPTVSTFDFNDPGLGKFTATSVSLISVHGGVNASAAWDVVGTFVPGSDWNNAGASITANETWALTQTGGPNNAISMSGTFHSPAVPVGVPEPATIALIGAALAGLGLRRKS